MSTIDEFHKEYYHSTHTWGQTYWMGTQLLKNPLDLWQYAEIIHELKPDLIIETGTAFGGSALFMAHMMDIVGRGKIVSIDLATPDGLPKHDRITYIQGMSSTSPEVFTRVLDSILVDEPECVMVILDSDHSYQHVRAEMQLFHPFVTLGSYLIVEDSNVNGNPVLPVFGPGPMEAITEFMRDNKDFAIDDYRERFMFTFNPRGYLKRIR